MAAVLVLAPAVAPSVSNRLELILQPIAGTPSDVILYPRPVEAAIGLAVITCVAMGISDSWPTKNQVTGGVEWYQDGIKYTGSASAGSAVFPPVGDVEVGNSYGPSGVEYTGTLVQPAASNVKSGISYGAGGIQFTGTYNPMAAAVFPVPADVRTSIVYGPTGIEYTGTYSGGGGLPNTLFEISQGKILKVLSDKYALLLT